MDERVRLIRKRWFGQHIPEVHAYFRLLEREMIGEIGWLETQIDRLEREIAAIGGEQTVPAAPTPAASPEAPPERSGRQATEEDRLPILLKLEEASRNTEEMWFAEDAARELAAFPMERELREETADSASREQPGQPRGEPRAEAAAEEAESAKPTGNVVLFRPRPDAIARSAETETPGPEAPAGLPEPESGSFLPDLSAYAYEASPDQLWLHEAGSGERAVRNEARVESDTHFWNGVEEYVRQSPDLPATGTYPGTAVYPGSPSRPSPPERKRAEKDAKDTAAVPSAESGTTRGPLLSERRETAAAADAPAAEDRGVSDAVASEIRALRYRYIVGKLAGADLLDEEYGKIVGKGETITAQIVDIADRAGKLPELIIRMTLPGLDEDA